MKWPQNNSTSVTAMHDELPTKQDSKGSTIPLVAAIVTLASSLLGFVNRFNKVGIAAVCIVALVLCYPFVVRETKAVQRFFRRWRFVYREREQLEDRFGEFVPFAQEHSGSSIVSLIHNLCSRNTSDIERIQSSRYIDGWMRAFNQQLSFPTTNIHCFMTRCEEFISMVYQFNCDYALKTQKALEQRTGLSEHDIDDLEHFREEFSAYLRALGEWSAKLAKDWSKIENNGQLFGVPFTSHFEHLKSFRKIPVLKA
jgi:hypothetical protein